MALSPEQTRLLTHALLKEHAVEAADALRGATDRAAVEGLVVLLHHPPAARAALAAITALDAADAGIVVDAVLAALGSPHASVRTAAVHLLQRRDALARGERPLLDLLRRDESWVVRRAALRALGSGSASLSVLEAATDPHWRVRHALIQILLPWGESESQQRELDERLARAGAGARVEGLRAYLRYRWSGRKERPARAYPPEDPAAWCPFWDWDVAVLARRLERLGKDGRRQAVDTLPRLLAHPDERVRAPALETLRHAGEPRHLAQAVELLDEPRLGTVEPVGKLLAYLTQDRAEEVARFVLHLPKPTPGQLAWAVDQAGEALPIEVEEATLSALLQQAPAQPRAVRCALARLTSRWPSADATHLLTEFAEAAEPEVQLEAIRGLNRQATLALEGATLARLAASTEPLVRAETVRALLKQGTGFGLLETLAADPDFRVRLAVAEGLLRGQSDVDSTLLARLQADPHPLVRASALTPEQAVALVRESFHETSWHVLATAARLARVPFWNIEPRPAWRPEVPPALPAEPLRPPWPELHDARLLGPNRLAVAPLGISGHYGLPVEGFVCAVEAGVNLLFWEPNYHTLTEFMTRLGPGERRRLHVLAGTFEADGARVRRDAERVLRQLHIERMAIFLLFWVQSWDRVAADVRAALEELKAEGKVAAYGLSTHNRLLAVEAMEAGWDPVMVRHSAAHRGAEQRIFPRAVKLGTSVLTFNNTCYGRLLQPHGEIAPPSAADCYRYTLAQPGVRACWSAPATLEELEEDLAVLRDPVLPDTRRRLLEAHGALVYEEDSTFHKLVRVL
jgi:HEAT repeat protein